MKRKLLLGALALAGGLTVVGSGFAAWYFEAGNLSASGNVNHHVTDLNTGVGTLTDINADDHLYIVLDQGGVSNATDLTKGVSIRNVSGTVSDSNLGTAVDYIGAVYTLEEEDWTTLTNAGITSGTFSSTFTLSEAAKTYLKFKPAGSSYTGETTLPDGDTGLSITDDVVTYSYTYTLPTTYPADGIKLTIKFDCKTTDGVNTILQYNSKPSTSAEYSTMKTTLQTAGTPLMTLSYSFTINTAA